MGHSIRENSICKVTECGSVCIDYHKNNICSQIKKKKNIYFVDRFNTLRLRHSGIARLYSSHSDCYQTFILLFWY